jgi:uncharacterized protein (TIGR00645 family)
MNDPTHHERPVIVSVIEGCLFNVKWILPLFYVGLVVVLGIYGITYAREIWDIILNFKTKTADQMEVVALNAIDIVMVANLIKMIISGSYNSFVSKLHGRVNENISSGTLKVKIATSIVVLSSIHLLKMFIDTAEVSSAELHKCIAIYLLFLASAVVLGALEYVHVLSEKIEKSH